MTGNAKIGESHIVNRTNPAKLLAPVGPRQAQINQNVPMAYSQQTTTYYMTCTPREI